MKRSYLPRKDSIILSAIEIIDELGIQELSIRELAKRQGVSEAALYRHFDSKQEILLAVLDHYAIFDSLIAQTVKERNFEAKEGIRFFVSSYCENYGNYPALTAILFAYDVLRYDPQIEVKIKHILEGRFNTLFSLVEQGQKQGSITTAITTENICHLINGLKRSIILDWRISNLSFPLKEKVMTALDSFLQIC